MPDYFVGFKTDADEEHNKWFIGEFADPQKALAHCNASNEVGPKKPYKLIEGASDYNLLEIQGDGSRTVYALGPSE